MLDFLLEVMGVALVGLTATRYIWLETRRRRRLNAQECLRLLDAHDALCLRIADAEREYEEESPEIEALEQQLSLVEAQLRLCRHGKNGPKASMKAGFGHLD